MYGLSLLSSIESPPYHAFFKYHQMSNIAIFASGTGSNAEKLILAAQARTDVSLILLFSNRKSAPVLEKAKKRGVQTLVFNRSELYESSIILEILENNKIDLIFLAGFLWLVPEAIIDHWQGRIVNIHPALLPKYGGKGMYGDKVHAEVLRQGEKESGITIHLVDKEYDQGKILLQKTCEVKPDDTPASLAERIHELEHTWYPRVMGDLLDAIQQK